MPGLSASKLFYKCRKAAFGEKCKGPTEEKEEELARVLIFDLTFWTSVHSAALQDVSGLFCSNWAMLILVYYSYSEQGTVPLPCSLVCKLCPSPPPAFPGSGVLNRVRKFLKPFPVCRLASETA